VLLQTHFSKSAIHNPWVEFEATSYTSSGQLLLGFNISYQSVLL